MSGEKGTRGGPRPPRWRRRLVAGAVLLALASVAAVAGVGWVPHRQWNRTHDESVRRFPPAPDHVGYTVSVVELDDQGVMWDPRQLAWALEHLHGEMTRREHGVVVLILVPGWKTDARWDAGGLADFRRSLERLARRVAASSDHGEPPGLMGLYVGWRGSSFDLPLLENLTFWNRRVAAHRAASTDLEEILLQVERLAGRDRTTKVVVVGHSMGGLIAEKTLYPALVAKAFAAGEAGRPVPLGLDLVVSVNPALSALEVNDFLTFLRRNRVRLVNRLADGSLEPAEGPLLASVNSGSDIVNRLVYPVGMWFNGLFLRYRSDHPDGAPSQRQLGRRAAGHEPSLLTHRGETEEGRLSLSELSSDPERPPYWLIRVSDDISAGHSEVDGPMFMRLMFELMNRNRLFDPDAELMLAAAPAGP